MKIFYQSSLPRSGSTLLQNILAQNPDFHATPSSGLLELIFGARVNYTNSPEFRSQPAGDLKKSFLAFCRGGMIAYCEALTHKPFLVDKSRGWGIHFDLLSEIFGEPPKIICMVRDLRQIVASMELIFRKNPERHRLAENAATLSGTTTFKRAVNVLKSQPVGLAIDRLHEICHRGWGRQILFVRYEDLTRNPRQSLQRIYQYLGVPEFEHDYSRVVQVTREDDGIHGMPGLHDIHHDVAPVTHDVSEILGAQTVQYINQNYQSYFKRFGYTQDPTQP